MKRSNRYAAVIAAALTMGILFLSGCGGGFAGFGTSKQETEQRQEQTAGANAETPGAGENTAEARKYGAPDEKMYYRIQETALPDPDRSLGLILETGQWSKAGWQGSSSFLGMGDTLYRTATIWNHVEYNGEELPGICGYILQYIAPPYTEWTNLELDGLQWEDNAYWNLCDLYVTPEGRMLVQMKKYTGTGEEDYEMGTGEVFRDGTYRLLTSAEQEGLDIDWSGQSVELNEKINQDMGKLGVFIRDLKTAAGENGRLYLADTRRLWQYSDEGPVELLTFTDQDYALDQMYGIMRTEDGFLVMGGYKQKCYLLQLTESSEPVVGEKKEIVLACSFVTDVEKEVIANFNRRSADYRVVTRCVTGTGTDAVSEFSTKIQMEMAAGKGPDILGPGSMWGEYANYADKGFLEPLSSVVEGDGDLMGSALKSGVINGVQYGIPLRYNLMFLCGRSDLTGGRSSWDVREMMSAVEQSGAEYLAFMDFMTGKAATGTDIVFYFGLTDNEDTTYIDWKAGVSHLTEQPFLELLEFAKKYAADEQAPKANGMGMALREGKVALTNIQVVMMRQLLDYEEIFEGKDSYIGYPGVEGEGVYLLSFNYYVNAFGQQKEGAKEFLRYLLTEDAQLILTDVEMGGGLPVRKSTLETNIALAQKNLGGSESGAHMQTMGIEYMAANALSKQQGEKLLALAERAEPIDWNANAIEDILEEELQPYFEGKRSAEDVAKVLDNRVQLYLNERN